MIIRFELAVLDQRPYTGFPELLAEAHGVVALGRGETLEVSGVP